MDTIQQFSYIVALEEFNTTMNNVDPAMEGAADVIRGAIDKAWKFIKSIIARIMDLIKSGIRKMRTIKIVNRSTAEHFNKVFAEYNKLAPVCGDLMTLLTHAHQGDVVEYIDDAKDAAARIEKIYDNLQDLNYVKDKKSMNKTVVSIDKYLNDIDKSMTTFGEMYDKIPKIAQDQLSKISEDTTRHRELTEFYNIIQKAFMRAHTTAGFAFSIIWSAT